MHGNGNYVQCILQTIYNAFIRSNMECFENNYSALHLMSNLQDNTPIIKSGDPQIK
jgi:hypothetical protein